MVVYFMKERRREQQRNGGKVQAFKPWFLRDYIEVSEEARCDGVSPSPRRAACTHKNDVDDLPELQALTVVPIGMSRRSSLDKVKVTDERGSLYACMSRMGGTTVQENGGIIYFVECMHQDLTSRHYRTIVGEAQWEAVHRRTLWWAC